MRILKVASILLVVVFTLISGAFAQEVKDEDIRVGIFQEMSYPLAARLDHVQGAVVVRAKLDKEGNVIAVEPISGAKLLIPDSVANAKTWTFSPNPQKAVVIVYQFRIDPGLCHGAVSSQFIFYPPNIATIRTCETVVDR